MVVPSLISLSLINLASHGCIGDMDAMTWLDRATYARAVDEYRVTTVRDAYCTAQNARIRREWHCAYNRHLQRTWKKHAARERRDARRHARDERDGERDYMNALMEAVGEEAASGDDDEEEQDDDDGADDTEDEDSNDDEEDGDYDFEAVCCASCLKHHIPTYDNSRYAPYASPYITSMIISLMHDAHLGTRLLVLLLRVSHVSM